MSPDFLNRHRRTVLYVLAAVGVLFGLATIVSGGRVILVAEAREAAGNVVPFVLWFNFLAGFGYVAAGVGLALRQSWGAWLAVAVAAATLLVLGAFAIHVLGGGAYEMRTTAAMILRTGVWAVIAALAYVLLIRKAAGAA